MRIRVAIIGTEFLLGGNENILGLDSGGDDCIYNLVNILKITGPHIL